MSLLFIIQAYTHTQPHKYSAPYTFRDLNELQLCWWLVCVCAAAWVVSGREMS